MEGEVRFENVPQRTFIFFVCHPRCSMHRSPWNITAVHTLHDWGNLDVRGTERHLNPFQILRHLHLHLYHMFRGRYVCV